MKSKRLIVCLAAVLVAASSTLSLTGCSLFHKHTYEWEVSKEPTCVEAGEEQFICKGEDGCGDVSDTRQIDALGHTAGDWEVSKEPECEIDGEEVKLCTVCGEVLETRTIEALEHIEGEWKVTTEPTCTEKGEKSLLCSLCEKVLETEEIDATGHEFPDEWSVVKEPTCSEEGIKEKKCFHCDETQTESIAMVSHPFGEWIIVKAATCSEAGTEKRTCSECGKNEERAVAKLSHSFGTWTIKKTATCSAEGVQQRVCSKCGQVETKSIAKVAHTFGNWKVTKQATTTAEGTQTRTCSVCGKTETQKIPKITGGNTGTGSGKGKVYDVSNKTEAQIYDLNLKVNDVLQGKIGSGIVTIVDTEAGLWFEDKDSIIASYGTHYKGDTSVVYGGRASYNLANDGICEHAACYYRFDNVLCHWTEGYGYDIDSCDVVCVACGATKHYDLIEYDGKKHNTKDIVLQTWNGKFAGVVIYCLNGKYFMGEHTTTKNHTTDTLCITIEADVVRDGLYKAKH